MAQPKLYNTREWVDQNKHSFLPPVCNKMMHGETQMKCFFVGGPNIRKDYHIEEGPEFFYMVKGDMCLKIMEHGQPKDIVIKEGETFMLPGRIPHSPQRAADTVGLVIERERLPHEKDGLRYFVERDGKPTSDVLYEKWFHCENLGPQLAAIINEYFETEQCKTGVPKPGTILTVDETPFKIDVHTTVDPPFSLNQWLNDNKAELESGGSLDLYKTPVAGQVSKIYGPGEVTMAVQRAEVFIWVLRGESTVKAKDTEYKLTVDDSFWLPVDTQFTMTQTDAESRVFMLYMDPPTQ